MYFSVNTMNRLPDNQSKPPSLWAMIWPRLKPYKGLVIAAITLNALHGFAVTFQTLITKYLIDDVILEKGLSMATRWQRLGLIIVAFLLASIVFRMLVWHLGYRIFTNVREKVLYSLRLSFFSHVNQLCLRFHRQNQSGELFNYLFGSPLGQIQNFFYNFAMNVPGSVFVLISTIAWVAFWDLPMTVVLCITVVTTVLMMQNSRATIHRLSKDYQKTEGSVSGYVADLLRGSRDIKLYAMENRIEQNFAGQIDLIRKKSYERDVNIHVQWMKQEASGYVCFAILCVTGFVRYFSNNLTIGEFQGYLTAFIALQGPLTWIYNVGAQNSAAQASLERIDSILSTTTSTPDPAPQSAREIPHNGAIHFDHLSFKYDSNPILHDINLTIPYGQHVALVGPSGSGKTTLFLLLLRLYDPECGSIRINAHDLRSFNGSDLRRHFGVVPQDPFLFTGTIRENLSVVAPSADDAAIEQACRRAYAWEFIEKMPQRLHTPVGEAGSMLSGGQRQRIAIARALLADPSYYIFDEATSALDTMSEQLIQQALEETMRGKTAFFIAHRLATVKTCDRILVLHNGMVVQDGSYSDLAGRAGLFAELVAGQQLRT